VTYKLAARPPGAASHGKEELGYELDACASELSVRNASQAECNYRVISPEFWSDNAYHFDQLDSSNG
jgi:hypothetical protein